METVRLAREIRIDWDPTTDDGLVRMNILSHLADSEGKATEFLSPKTKQFTTRTISEICELTITDDVVDPITNVSLTNISGAGVMALIKKISEQIIQQVEQELEMQRQAEELLRNESE